MPCAYIEAYNKLIIAIRCPDYRWRFPNIETNESLKFFSFACFLLFDRFTV